jgi:hypothetical protein
MKEVAISTKIKSCEKCMFFTSERAYTSDSFEMCFDWFCTNSEKKKIRGYVDWNEKVPIPDWCPIRVTVPEPIVDKHETELDIIESEKKALSKLISDAKARLKQIKEDEKNSVRNAAVKSLSDYSTSEKTEIFDNLYALALDSLNSHMNGIDIKDEEQYAWESVMEILAKDKGLFWKYYNHRD